MEIIIDGKKYICFEAKEFFEELNKNGYKWDGKMVVKSTSQPKFKVGDWVVRGDTIAQILDIQEQYYVGLDINGKDFTSSRFLNDDKIHLWTIQDAKDGDVLACGDKVTDCPFIFHNLTEALNPRSYCGVNTLHHFQDNDENGGFWCRSDEVRPATKEQRDFLFQKMKEAGYKWDADAKKLIKTTIPIPKFKFGDIIKHKDTGVINSIKYVCSDYYVLDNNQALFFESQDMWELAASKANPSLEDEVSMLADEIIALKQRVLDWRYRIKDMGTPPLTQVYSCPDKAGDNVTLEEMKG